MHATGAVNLSWRSFRRVHLHPAQDGRKKNNHRKRPKTSPPLQMEMTEKKARIGRA